MIQSTPASFFSERLKVKYGPIQSLELKAIEILQLDL